MVELLSNNFQFRTTKFPFIFLIVFFDNTATILMIRNIEILKLGIFIGYKGISILYIIHNCNLKESDLFIIEHINRAICQIAFTHRVHI